MNYELGSIRPELQLPREKEFYGKDEQHAHTRGGRHFDKETKDGSHLDPLDEQVLLQRETERKVDQQKKSGN